MRRPPEHRIALAVLLLTLAGFGTYAVVADQRPGYADSMLPDAARLWEAITGRPVIGGWLASTTYRPPLAYAPASLLFLASGGPYLSVLRFSVLLQYLLLVWLAYSTGRLLHGRWAGLLSAAVVGTFPMLMGWGRLGYMDLGLATVVLLCVRVLLGVDFERPREGVRLGAAVGAGLLVKVGFPLFGAGAVLWTVALKLRSRRALLTLAVAVGTALLVAGWWYVAQWEMVVINAGMSQGAGAGELDAMLASARRLVWELPGGAAVLAAAALGSAVAWRLRLVRPASLLLLSLTLWPPLLALLNFVPLRRYVLPIYPPAGVLAATCLVAVVAHVRPAAARIVALCGTAALLLLVTVPLNLGLWRPDMPKTDIYLSCNDAVDGLGILAPDTRPNPQLQRMSALAKERGFARCLLVPNSFNMLEQHQALSDALFYDRGDDFHMTASLEDYRPDPPHRVCAMVATPADPDHNDWPTTFPQREQGIYDACRTYAWFREVRPRAEYLGAAGPSSVKVRYVLYRLPVDTLAVKPPPAPYCQLEQVFWDQAVHARGEDEHGASDNPPGNEARPQGPR